MWKTLTTQLYNLLIGKKAALGIQEGYSYPRLTFNGYVGFSIFPSDVPSDYETNTENLRIYAFKLRLFDETRSQGLESAMDNLSEVVDSVMDELDVEATRDSSARAIAVGLPSDKTYIDMEAVPGFWGQVDSEGLVFTELTIRIKISVDLD